MNIASDVSTISLMDLLEEYGTYGLRFTCCRAADDLFVCSIIRDDGRSADGRGTCVRFAIRNAVRAATALWSDIPELPEGCEID